MLSHLIGVFWALPGSVEVATRSPPQGGIPPFYFRYFDRPDFEAGPFGVALFFLISGLVIPLSLRNRSVTGFLLGRVVRLWPTYAAALLLDVGVVSVAARHWGRPYHLSLAPLVGNLFLVFNYFGQFSIDLVNWSLGVETRFYLLAALIVLLCHDIAPRTLLLLSVCATVGEITWRIAGAPMAAPVEELARETMYVQFMLIGCLFHSHLTGRLSYLEFAGALGLGTGLFAASWRAGPLGSLFPTVTWSYLDALALFTAAYFARRTIPRLRVVGWLADISFPLYLTQSIVGYSLLKFLMISGGMTYTSSLIIAIAVLFLVSGVLHVLVERPTMRVAHAVGRRSIGRSREMQPSRY